MVSKKLTGKQSKKVLRKAKLQTSERLEARMPERELKNSTASGENDALAPTSHRKEAPCVDGGCDEPLPAPHKKGIVERKRGSALRRMTIYLPPTLAKQLELASVSTEKAMSLIITEAVEKWLKADPSLSRVLAT